MYNFKDKKYYITINTYLNNLKKNKKIITKDYINDKNNIKINNNIIIILIIFYILYKYIKNDI